MMMKRMRRSRAGRFVKQQRDDGMERGPSVSSALSASASSGEKEEEAGEDGGPAGEERTAEEASQSSGAALSLHFPFTHF